MKSFNDEELVSEGKHYTFDVVCGMDIIAEKTKHSSEYRGTVYYFCSHTCQKHFDNLPERYVWEEL